VLPLNGRRDTAARRQAQHGADQLDISNLIGYF
jgi:hypothetical protein